ncbi:hypothetical protein ISF_06473 [Cordyceps fumosorosea ARSEF 2679]|uniref:Uncharacterized protein n=1 Tax=Cordyceps fumosorosea (strain ARSEF 2679) TaxID=1081104 RepID=A0A167RKR4_CORFA|nr:hypothetical protein ISF_06473 [Cordyceps fumosorosea ARSEF 2679]OAA58690.1 hypothetical protein ISF_06473 [Cordyceps fumosorosea ARSEF 2679]
MMHASPQSRDELATLFPLILCPHSNHKRSQNHHPPPLEIHQVQQSLPKSPVEPPPPPRRSTRHSRCTSPELIFSPAFCGGGGQGAQHRGPEAESTPRTTASTTSSWSPDLQRRQSWSAQDRKHELHMAAVDDVRTGPGFSERSA